MKNWKETFYVYFSLVDVFEITCQIDLGVIFGISSEIKKLYVLYKTEFLEHSCGPSSRFVPAIRAYSHK